MRKIFAMMLAFSATSSAEKRKPVPTQAPIVRECVTISEIYSHGGGGGFALREPGIDATVTNNCGVPAHVLVTIGYFDAKEVQIGVGVEMSIIAPSTVWKFRHPLDLTGRDRGRFRVARIIEASAHP